LIYFSTLLETTKLNDVESMELAKPVLAQNRVNLIEDWIKADKLTCTSGLGDLV
jgi:clathrin heavy chain